MKVRAIARAALAVPAVRGAVVGAVLAGAIELLCLAWAMLTLAGDTASLRAAEAVTALGSERGVFAAQILLMVAAMGALIGGAQGWLRHIARRPGRPAGPLWHDIAWTGGLFAWILLGRTCSAPALLASSLPLPTVVVAWLTAHVPPQVFRAVALGAVGAAVARGIYHRRRSALALTAAGVGVLACYGCAHTPKATPAKPNVLFLASDSIRPDHLSALGYPRPTTPNLDHLIAEGTLFDRTLAPLAMTTPSWVSILTGRYPHSHGVRHMFPDRALRPASMGALPKIAEEQGYRTSVLSDYAGDFFPLFEFGFEQQKTSPRLNVRTVFQRDVLLRSPLALAFLEPLPNALRPACFRYFMNGADAERLADDIIDQFDGDKPFFTVAFFSTTHVPFASQYPNYRQFASPQYGGEHRYAYNLTSITDIARAEKPLDAADAAQIVALYDGALAAVDTAIGRVLRALRDRGLDKNTIVIFLSDHGENLFEPGQTTLHGKWFRGGDEANRVPFVLRGPNVPAGKRVSEPVSLVDVTPTLTDWLGWPALARAEGRSLAPVLRGQELPTQAIFSETGAWLNGPVDPDSMPMPPLHELLDADDRDDGQIVLRARYEDAVVSAKHRALWEGPLKLLYEPTRDGVRWHLYDVIKDPHQTNDLYPTHPESRRLVKLMKEWLAKDPERELDARQHVVRRAD